MTFLILGLLLWTLAHYFRRILPGLHAELGSAIGAGPLRSVITLDVLLALGLIYWGYSSMDFIHVWAPPDFFKHINNLLMVLALYIYLTTVTRPGTAFVMGSVKHPQLIGFKTWTIAHLLVNGDLASIILFGGLLAWSVGQVILLNRAGGTIGRETAPIRNPWLHLALVLVVFTVVAGIHTVLGVNPFGG